MQEWEQLSYYWDDDGSLVVRGRLAPEDGALFLKALEAGRETALERAARRSRSAVPRNRRRCRAGRATSTRWSRSPRTRSPTRATRTDGGDRFQVLVHVEQEALDREGDGSCLLADGPAVAPETARRLACDASIVTLLERAGEPLGVGRKTRKIPWRSDARSRRATAAAASPAAPAAASRPTTSSTGQTAARPSSANLVLLCRRHHRLVHEGGWTVDHQHRFRNRFGHPRARRPTPATRQPHAPSTTPIGSSASPPRPTRPATATRWTSTSPSATSSTSSDDPGNGSRKHTTIVDGLIETLRGRRHGRYTIEGARWYGSVCNGPRHVVVQVALGGAVNHELPTDTHWLDAAPPRNPGSLRTPRLAANLRHRGRVLQWMSAFNLGGRRDGSAARRDPSPPPAWRRATAA